MTSNLYECNKTNLHPNTSQDTECVESITCTALLFSTSHNTWYDTLLEYDLNSSQLLHWIPQIKTNIITIGWALRDQVCYTCMAYNFKQQCIDLFQYCYVHGSVIPYSGETMWNSMAVLFPDAGDYWMGVNMQQTS